jgi:small-conductance mechanosensitive channel
MWRFNNALPLGLVALVLLCAVGWFLTRDTGLPRGAAKEQTAGSAVELIDQRLLQAAQQLASLADTHQEQVLAREALRLADHELDQALATALREAAASPPPPTGPLKQLADRIKQLKARLSADQEHIAKLAPNAASDTATAARLELAKAQQALDQDELEDAQQDLARQGGDNHARLQRALQAHEAAQNAPEQPLKSVAAPQIDNLSEQVQVWISLASRENHVEAARQQAESKAAALGREHDALEKLIGSKTASGTPAATSTPNNESSEEEDDNSEDTDAMLARLRHLSDQRKTLTELDKRIQDSQQLEDVYKRWGTAAATRRRSVLHLLLSSLAGVFTVFLAVVLIDRAIRHGFRRQTDRRRLHQLQVIATIAVQLIGASLILLIIFGPPNQMPTIIGLATAGLTVVMKDFIVSFFGWFALMGKNGIRVGDWVEINGVGGEVIEIGILKTVLLEMGNWTSTGHPTGRRVAFVNSFAIEGHYFNFSTAGQWLWDELRVSLPAAGDPYLISQRIRQTVERETDVDAKAAEEDWERVTKQYGMRSFSAKPAVELRPSPTGLEVIVRYITRAPQRYEVKSKLFTAIVDLLHKPAEV